MVPVAILIAGVLIAGTLIYKNNQGEKAQNVGNTKEQNTQTKKEVASLDNMLPVTAKDHIRGNPGASVIIVEYSDFECPFCKSFHNTMNQVMDEYGKSGKVAWVYRQFPLDSLHPVKARRESVASECAAELGGNEKFWQFADRFFELTPSNNQTDIDTVLPQIASEIGLDTNKFQECLESSKYDEHIKSDIDNAITTGGRGTPWSILIDKKGNMFPINGAQPYNVVKQLIDTAITVK